MTALKRCLCRFMDVCRTTNDVGACLAMHCERRQGKKSMQCRCHCTGLAGQRYRPSGRPDRVHLLPSLSQLLSPYCSHVAVERLAE